MIVDKVWKFINTLRVGLTFQRSSHSQRQTETWGHKLQSEHVLGKFSETPFFQWSLQDCTVPVGDPG